MGIHRDAFLPNLARGLGAWGSILMDAHQPAEAAEAFAEGVRLMIPLARVPAAFSDLTMALAGGYLATCEAAGSNPIPNSANLGGMVNP